MRYRKGLITQFGDLATTIGVWESSTVGIYLQNVPRSRSIFVASRCIDIEQPGKVVSGSSRKMYVVGSCWSIYIFRVCEEGVYC